ncbi:MAG: C45 family peptidase [Polyangiaceae bacterium]|nr:C45 family peptidase [Polyangiaceae bacterium]
MELELTRLECRGTPRELGLTQGEALREKIQGFVAQRLDAAAAYLGERGPYTVKDLLAVGAQCLEASLAFHSEGYAEHVAIAEAARVDPGHLYAATNMTDVRDVLLLGKRSDSEGCSVALVPENLSRDRKVIAAQTWDLNPTDLDYVVAIHRIPTDGPRTWSVTCAGALSLVGMNEHGLTVGTTNIKTHGSRVGVGYLSILHRALTSRTREQAADFVRRAPRAGGHTYFLADRYGAQEFECSATACVERTLGTEPIARTNHCLSPTLRALEGEAASNSSVKRLERLKAVLSTGGHNVESIRALFSDRSDGVDSINRYAEDDQGTSTNACFVGIPEALTLSICRGSPDRGRWVTLSF